MKVQKKNLNYLTPILESYFGSPNLFIYLAQAVFQDKSNKPL